MKTISIINVNENNIKCEPFDKMYGIFFEEINHAGDGGLYAELVRNRNFMDTVIPEGSIYYDGYIMTKNGHKEKFDISDSLPGWKLMKDEFSKATIESCMDNPRNPDVPNHMIMTVDDYKTGKVKLVNSGYWGMGVSEGKYTVRIIMKSEDIYTVKIGIQGNGKVLGEKIINGITSDYLTFIAEIHCMEICGDGELFIEPLGNGKLYIDFVSLFPNDTYKGRKNGLRKDIGQAIEKLNPGFVRFPGGCIVEGMTISNAYEFRETIGPVEDRKGKYNLWGYRRTNGFGYHEFLELCEDLDAEAMYVCNCAMACGARRGEHGSDEDMEYFLQDTIDAIEYALGDINTKWGSARAKNGHPSPFNLKYIEIGNENGGAFYNKSYKYFYDRLKSIYPYLIYIINDASGTEADKYDILDEHYYCEPHYFPAIADKYDKYERNRKIYVGEYACNTNVGIGNHISAASEAAFMIGMEKNADVVRMASYAPLLCNINNRAWPVNLINFNSEKCFGIPSYYLQCLFNENLAEKIVDTNHTTNSFNGAVKLFASGGLKNGNLIIKAVNFGADKNALSISFKKEYKNVIVKYIEAEFPEDENTIDEPEKINIKRDFYELNKYSASFEYEMNPYGIYVFEFTRY